MQKQTPTNQEEARQYAIDWQNWISKGDPISYVELVEWQEEFEAVACKFDLIEEFKENAII